MSKTGTIKVFSNQTATFNHPNNRDEKARVRAYEFATVPEWVIDSEMFQMLRHDGKIEVINSNLDVSKIEQADGKLNKLDVLNEIKEPENNGVAVGGIEDTTNIEDSEEEQEDVPEATEEEEDTTNEDSEEDSTNEEEVTDEFTGMSNKDLYNLCIEKGIEVEQKKNRKYYVQNLTEAVENTAE